MTDDSTTKSDETMRDPSAGMSTTRALDQFVSTFKEWHYFIGGAALGFVLGLCVALLWFVAFGWVVGL